MKRHIIRHVENRGQHETYSYLACVNEMFVLLHDPRHPSIARWDYWEAAKQVRDNLAQIEQQSGGSAIWQVRNMPEFEVIA